MGHIPTGPIARSGFLVPQLLSPAAPVAVLQALATVDVNGTVTGITVTNPGTGYSDATVNITGAGTGATATASVNLSGSVVAINPYSISGSGYTAPTVSITSGGGTGAAGIVYGGVDAVNLTVAGSGYTNPTVDFDLPDGPDGVKAVAHATWNAGTGVITGIVVDQPGSGYSFAPAVIIRNGTLFDPLPPATTAATATATLKVQTVALTNFGTGYTSAPNVAIADS